MRTGFIGAVWLLLLGATADAKTIRIAVFADTSAETIGNQVSAISKGRHDITFRFSQKAVAADGGDFFGDAPIRCERANVNVAVPRRIISFGPIRGFNHALFEIDASKQAKSLRIRCEANPRDPTDLLIVLSGRFQVQVEPIPTANRFKLIPLAR